VSSQREQPAGLPGIDQAKVGQWLSTLSIAPAQPLNFSLLAHGKSNITAVVRAADGRRWVLRRPPLGKLLPTAHDVGREHRILAALRDTAVPAPSPIALTSDPAVTDVPLLLMEHVEGLVIDDIPTAEPLPQAFRRAVGRSMVKTLAAVHDLDLAAVGLSDLAPPGPLAARQLTRWRAQWERSRTRDVERIDRLGHRLAAAMPSHEDRVLVHGDYHLRNAIVDPTSGRVRAVLDWELSTLGDPLADLGLLLALWAQSGDPPGQPFTASTLPGFPTRDELVQQYATITGRDLVSIDFWEVFALWKLAIILEGVRRRALDDPRNAARGATIASQTVDAILERAWNTAHAIGI
jgi:aminoglycoside phosphotransferase (APT) family kinase protein